MNFSIFDHKKNINALTWLGHKDWIVYKNLEEGISAYPKKILFNPREKVIKEYLEKSPHELPIIVGEKELKTQPQETWDILKSIIECLQYDPLGTFWYYTLSKSLAGGPKIFRPLPQQCEALQHSTASYSFDDYKQPYPVIILEIPAEYGITLKNEYNIPDTPKFVFVHHDEKNKFINVSAFFNMRNVITHFTPRREKYATIEESIVGSRREEQDAEFNAAENVQRLGINFAMMMSLYSIKCVGPYNAPNYKQWEVDAKYFGKPTNRNLDAKTNLNSTLHLLQFEQNVSFYDEVNIDTPVGEGVEIDQLRKSPKTHWRRGHFAAQPCGIGRRERKIIFRRPVMVRAAYFFGDVQNTSVVYTAKKTSDLVGQKIKVTKAEDVIENTIGTITKVKNFKGFNEIEAMTENGNIFHLISPPDEYQNV